ncbi:hypothetical protein ACFX10_036122 [Malus domestica]
MKKINKKIRPTRRLRDTSATLIAASCTTVFRIFSPSASSLILKNFIITRIMTMTIMMITAWRLPRRLPLCLPPLIIICCSKTLQGRFSRQNHGAEKGMVVFVVLTD